MKNDSGNPLNVARSASGLGQVADRSTSSDRGKQAQTANLAAPLQDPAPAAAPKRGKQRFEDWMVILPFTLFDPIFDDLTGAWPDGPYYFVKAGTVLFGPGKGTAAARGARSLDDLSRAAGALDRGGYSAAGRQLQKHGSRPGSAFPAARGNPAAINRQGQAAVDDILTSPGTTTVTRHHARFGDVTEIRAPDGRGVRYGSNGDFLGFLEPRP